MAEQPQPRGMLARALDLARLGFRVFPIAPGRKHPPMMAGWPELATTDPAKIIQMWAGPNANCNIGIATGYYGENKWLVVPDFDCRDGKQGLLTYHKWHDDGLMNTRRARTPSGGKHTFFWCDEPINSSLGTVAPDVDIKGLRGYVLGAGSIIGTKTYQWDDGSPTVISPLPDALKKIIKTAKATSATVHAISGEVLLDSETSKLQARMYIVNEAPEAHEGNRGDETTLRVAQRVRAYGVSQPVCLELMLGYYNDKCFPPWTPEEMEKKVANAYKYADRTLPPGSASIEQDGLLSDEVIAKREAAAKIANENAQAKLDGTSVIDINIGDDEPSVFSEEPEDKDNPHVPDWMDLFDADNHQLPVIEHLVEGWMPMGYAGLFPAYGGSGKSTLMVQLVVCVASGQSWLGLDTKQGLAVYVCAEDGDVAVKRRMMVIMKHYGVRFADVYGKSLLVWACGDLKHEPMMFVVGENGELETTKRFEHFLNWATKTKPALIVLDPLSHVFDGDENNRRHARAAMFQLRRLAKASGGVVVMLQHPSVEGLRSGRLSSGSTGWHGGARFQLVIEKIGIAKGENVYNVDRGFRRLTIQKTQFGKPGEFIDLQYKNGLFLPISEGEKAAREELAQVVFLELLRRYTQEGRPPSSSVNAHGRYAPAVFAEEADAEEQGLGRDEFVKAMADLFAAGQIAEGSMLNAQRHKRPCIVAVAGGVLD